MIETIEAYAGVSVWSLLILFFVSLIAETYGSVFGGGGLLIQPVMLALGIPPQQAVANDVSACLGSGLSRFYVFKKSKYIVYDIVKWALPGGIIGPLVGAGAGMFSVLVLHALFGLNLRYSMGTRSLVHLPIYITSFISYSYLGLVNWVVLVPMLLGTLIAGWAGSTIALKLPEKILRPLFFSVILLLSLSILI